MKNNHFAAWCLAGQQVAYRQNCCTSKDIDAGCSEQLRVNDDFDILNVGVKKSESQTDWMVSAATFGGEKIKLKVDTESKAKLPPYALYTEECQAPDLKPSQAALRAYDGGLIKHVGVTRLRLKTNEKEAYVGRRRTDKAPRREETPAEDQ